jgi:transcriptional regulator with XRE-family HTH domain
MYANFQELGKALKECRESVGLSAQDVAAQLKIRLQYIEAMEKGEFTQLPGTLYAEGHLRSYSRFLKLNEAAMLQSFRDLSKNIDKKESFALPDHFSNERRPPTAFAVSMLMLAFVVYGTWYFIHDSEASQSQVEPLVASTVAAPTASAPAPTSLEQGDGNVVLLATGTTEISLFGSTGELVNHFSMKAGDTFFLPNRQDLSMKASDEKVVDVFVDGEEVTDMADLRHGDDLITLNLWQLKNQLQKSREPAQ